MGAGAFMAKAYLSDDFLLDSDAAAALYHGCAEPLPLFDYHTHLSVRDIADDRIFRTITEAWLDHDHYKWRAMRWNGVEEKYCTGKEGDAERFMAWAKTVPFTLRNPLYDWTHLELDRVLGIRGKLLNGGSAPEIYREATDKISSRPFSARNLLLKMKVAVLFTTDDPLSDLRDHARISSDGFPVRVLPTFRPDILFSQPGSRPFLEWIERLGSAAGLRIHDPDSLIAALRLRHDFFHAAGCRLSDHSLEGFKRVDSPAHGIGAIVKRFLAGKAGDAAGADQFRFWLLTELAAMDAEKSWVMQLHIGAYRNMNPVMHRALGPNIGFDGMDDAPLAGPLAALLGTLAGKNTLPKMILYNLNPGDNATMAACLGCFQSSPVPARLQYGPAWWFLDQKEGIVRQLNTLSAFGLLSRFTGMVTDSRSFLSFPRHEYFRRILCNLLGAEVEKGELPQDMSLLKATIEGICFNNARSFILGE
jgi:glucuronate isomerase